jgi:hypothetical protein
MTDYTVISKYRNKDQCQYLIDKLREKGKTCYNFLDESADPENPDGEAEEQMKAFESTKDFFGDEHFKKLFEKDLEGLKNAREVVMLLPAGNSVHMEAGIAYGLGKKLILVGEPEKPESLYLVFDEHYESIEKFLKTVY